MQREREGTVSGFFPLILVVDECYYDSTGLASVWTTRDENCMGYTIPLPTHSFIPVINLHFMIFPFRV